MPATRCGSPPETHMALEPLLAALAGPCALHAVTGLWCPLCGGTRATAALLRGDLVAALGWNPYAVLLDAVAVLVFLRLVRRHRAHRLPRPAAPGQGPRRAPLSAREAAVLVVLGAVFLMARNLPALEPVLSASLTAARPGS